MKTIEVIDVKWPPTLRPAEFWKKYDAGVFGKPLTNINAPAFQQWMKDVAAMPAEQQVVAVSKKLVELNPGFDGNLTGLLWKGTPRIVNGVVTLVGLHTDNVMDISPLRALVGVRTLGLTSNDGKGMLSDLSPLRGLPISELFCHGSALSDLSPIKGIPLSHLSCNDSAVSDLSHLEGMPLTTLNISNTPVSNLTPLESCRALTSVNVKSTKVVPASVAALQKALPNCKIEWDDPAKATTPAKPDR